MKSLKFIINYFYSYDADEIEIKFSIVLYLINSKNIQSAEEFKKFYDEIESNITFRDISKLIDLESSTIRSHIFLILLKYFKYSSLKIAFLNNLKHILNHKPIYDKFYLNTFKYYFPYKKIIPQSDSLSIKAPLLPNIFYFTRKHLSSSETKKEIIQKLEDIDFIYKITDRLIEKKAIKIQVAKKEYLFDAIEYVFTDMINFLNLSG